MEGMWGKACGEGTEAWGGGEMMLVAGEWGGWVGGCWMCAMGWWMGVWVDD